MQLPASQSASSLLKATLTSHRFTSTCSAIDALLTPAPQSVQLMQLDRAGPGLTRGVVLELMGPPGVGKSRTAMGFLLAERFREDGGEVLVVDAEGSLSPGIISATAQAYAEHHGYDAEAAQAALEGLRYRRIDSAWLLVAFFNMLETWIADHPNVHLIVIDSLSSHLRHTLDTVTRKLLCDTIRSTLGAVCSARHVSIILTTKMSIKLFGLDNRPSSWSPEAEAILVPQLREDWLPIDSPAVGICRVLLYWDQQGERHGRLLTSSAPTQARDAAFTMDLLGPCDYPPSAPAGS
ncbi:hypothetical protein JCM21900_004510 [Sporobolomyces salmonicolor]